MELKPYKTLLSASKDELIINKSRFICRGFPAGSEEEALSFLKHVRGIHQDATHNCYAYAIGANMGIGFWPDFSWEKVNSHRVRLLEITNPQCSRDILITYKNNKQDNTRTKAFYTFLTKYFELASHHCS